MHPLPQRCLKHSLHHKLMHGSIDLVFEVQLATCSAHQVWKRYVLDKSITLSWFKTSDDEPGAGEVVQRFIRHPWNSRKHEQVKANYKAEILRVGLLTDVAAPPIGMPTSWDFHNAQIQLVGGATRAEAFYEAFQDMQRCLCQNSFQNNFCFSNAPGVCVWFIMPSVWHLLVKGFVAIRSVQLQASRIPRWLPHMRAATTALSLSVRKLPKTAALPFHLLCTDFSVCFTGASSHCLGLSRMVQSCSPELSRERRCPELYSVVVLFPSPGRCTVFVSFRS
jgi:hypothetical protein